MKNLITLVGAIFSLFLGISTFAIESLSYSVLEEAGEIEIREYEPHILASVQVAGNFEDAGSKAFRPLFKFITGENIGKEKIAMTAPVFQTTQDSQWLISFVMPREYDLDSLPVPASAVVEVSSEPAVVMAAMQYSGGWSKSRYDKHEALMMIALADGGYLACGEPKWARHNAPFTPWFMRKNEILVPVCTPKTATPL